METGQGSFPSSDESPEEENQERFTPQGFGADANPPYEDDSGPEEIEGELVPDEPDFETQVLRVLQLIEDDPANRDRVLAEVYVFISSFERNFRIMQASLMNIGPREMLKAMFKKDKGEKGGD